MTFFADLLMNAASVSLGLGIAAWWRKDMGSQVWLFALQAVLTLASLLARYQ